MIINTNLAGLMTLNKVNKNTSALSKSLSKVSSGMKINGAADDASGYAISEGMRVQIRALNQADANTQNATSLLKVAEGALSSTVEILKGLKQKAIDAANDTNTDADRAIIQKEVDQQIDQISDNAEATFNGRRLFTGDSDADTDTKSVIIKALHTEWIVNALNMIYDTYGVGFDTEETFVNDMQVNFVNKGAGVLASVSWTPTSDGKAVNLNLNINMDYYETMDWKDVNGDAGTTYLDRTLAHEMTHAIMAATVENMASLPMYIVEGMAELTHGIDDQRDSTILSFAQNSSSLNTLLTAKSTSYNTGDTDYAAGYILLRYLGAQTGGDADDCYKRLMEQLVMNGGKADALDSAINTASKGKFSNLDDLIASLKADQDAANDEDASGYTFLKKYCNIDLPNVDTGSGMGYDAGMSREQLSPEDVVPEGGSTKFWYYPQANYTNISGLNVYWGDFTRPKPGLTFQVGTKAGQVINAALSDIHAEAIGLMDDNGKTIQLTTQTKASRAIALLDNALRKALDQQTYVGALMSRMEYTSANLVTASENTTNAESVIRDADMAKEMTEYMKNNVLTQSSQAMLQNANQNSMSALDVVNNSTGSVDTVDSENASYALHQVNENEDAFTEAMEQVSSGMKLNSAGDGASEYAISRKMQVQIRSLEQDIENVKTGSNLIAIAEGAEQSILDNLRTIKELTLNASNDTNTDVDRATMQKEIDQRLEEIDDIAATTNYNGRVLLSGNYRKIDSVINTTKTEGVTVGSGKVKTSANTLSGMASQWTPGAGTTLTTGTNLPSKEGTPGQYMFSGNGMHINLNFTGTKVIATGKAATVADFDGQGFLILCHDCYQYCSIKFDTSLDNSKSTFNARTDSKNTQAVEYVIGLKDYLGKSLTDIPEAIYNGIASADRTQPYASGNVLTTMYPDTTNDLAVDISHDFRILKNADSTYTFFKHNSNAFVLNDEVHRGGSTVTTYIPGDMQEPLVIHHGTKANQALHVFIADMHVTAMGADDIDVTSRAKAQASIKMVDSAIEYVLDDITMMGAYRARLETTEANLVTSHENTQNTESVMTDADMAKAMLEYTKYNILMKSAQAMLAQANQRRQLTLGLLQ